MPFEAPDSTSHRRGAAGETIACAFLAARGYAIVARNLRIGRVELDVLARRGRTWIVVEVKWRGGPDAALGAGMAWIPRQRARAAAAVGALRGRYDPEALADWRFDLVAIDERPNGLTLTHHRGAWAPREEL